MLVFSPATLPAVLDSLTFNSPSGLKCAEPARALYLLARFACLACDDTWLEDLMGGAVDRIERIIFVSSLSQTSDRLLIYILRLIRTISCYKPFGCTT